MKERLTLVTVLGKVYSVPDNMTRKTFLTLVRLRGEKPTYFWSNNNGIESIK